MSITATFGCRSDRITSRLVRAFAFLVSAMRQFKIRLKPDATIELSGTA
jgi:hypothetical protein